MEWRSVQHLDLRHVVRGLKPLQPHAATFHPNQPLIAAAVGNYIVEFDAYTGSKISSINIGAPVVRMLYSPVSGHVVIAMLEDCTIRSCDFDTEQTCVLHSPEKRMERISSDTEVHLALTPLQPVVFFGFHRRMSVTVVGTVEGGKAPTKIKTDMKKPIVNLVCHPRLPVLYVAYADGLIRAYNIHTYAVHYTLQFDTTNKLIGAGAFAFHPTLEWIFVGDRKGTLLAWDVSTERPNMIGITQVGLQPITSIAWIPTLRLLITLSKDGTLQVWKTRVINNPNRHPMQTNFFELAASVLKEKLSSLGSSGILADHQLQMQLQEHHWKGQGQLTISDIARKAFLHSPFHLELNFFNKANRVLHYPVRAFYVDGINLMAYNLCSGVDNIYKKLYTSVPGNVECYSKRMFYSVKQHLFLIVFEFSGGPNEVVVYWENTNSEKVNSKEITVKGQDAAFIGPNENQFAILDNDQIGLALYILPGLGSQEVGKSNSVLDVDSTTNTNASSIRGPLQFMFEAEVDRIFSSPLESTIMYASHGSHIGSTKLIQGYRLSVDNGQQISPEIKGKKTIKLKVNEIVLQVHWQETLRGHVAGILTTHRVMIVSADLDVLASSFTKFDKGLPSISSVYILIRIFKYIL
ncbi:hypothetical protein IFM89_032588 [Coptis chinensis]|uniref:Uncharacterized protein n=1 Tax=Coptis chinensis TaxID=261450 RepID=A0A835IUT7_9MAGN|nr:hypothetical protein IFM89_032588 [Coptis chinensis]